MSKNALYRIIDEELLELVDIKISKQYYFFINEEKIPLKEDKIDPLNNSDTSYSIMDANRRWVSKRNENSLFLDITVSINNVVHFFNGPCRVSNRKATLGVGLSWQIGNSKVKHSIKLGQFNDYLDDVTIRRNGIEVENPGADIVFSLFIYVVDPGIDESKDGYASQKGMILYSNKEWSIIVSGNASIFPVFEHSKPGEPLWTVETYFDDWKESQFDEENLCILINRAHPLYPDFINEENFELHKEVVTSAMSCLVCQIMDIARDNETYSDLNKGHIETDGTILGVIKYLRDALSVRVDGLPQDIFKTLKMSKGVKK